MGRDLLADRAVGDVVGVALAAGVPRPAVINKRDGDGGVAAARAGGRGGGVAVRVSVA